MIYHLFEYLRQYDIPGQGLFTYLSFRAMLTSITAMLLSFFAGRKIIKWLQRKQIGETIRDLGLEGQMQKKGTPTMGGVIIILAIVVPVLLFCNLRNIYIQLLLLTTVWCGALGFADDYIKVFKHNKEGLHPKAKLVCQLALGLVIGLAVCFSDDIVIREKGSRCRWQGQCSRARQPRSLERGHRNPRGGGFRLEDGECHQEHKDHDPVREGPRV